jgi:hypothetical protein
MTLCTVHGGRPSDNEIYAWQIQVKDLEDGTDLMFAREVSGFPAFGEIWRALQEVASLS